MGHTQTILISDWWMGGKFVSLSGMRQSWICTLLDHTSNLMIVYYYYYLVIKHPIVQMWVSNNHVYIQGNWTFQASKSMWFLLTGGICCINLQNIKQYGTSIHISMTWHVVMIHTCKWNYLAWTTQQWTMEGSVESIQLPIATTSRWRTTNDLVLHSSPLLSSIDSLYL